MSQLPIFKNSSLTWLSSESTNLSQSLEFTQCYLLYPWVLTTPRTQNICQLRADRQGWTTEWVWRCLVESPALKLRVDDCSERRNGLVTVSRCLPGRKCCPARSPSPAASHRQFPSLSLKCWDAGPPECWAGRWTREMIPRCLFGQIRGPGNLECRFGL
jgi:hypothetical protein